MFLRYHAWILDTTRWVTDAFKRKLQVTPSHTGAPIRLYYTRVGAAYDKMCVMRVAFLTGMGENDRCALPFRPGE